MAARPLRTGAQDRPRQRRGLAINPNFPLWGVRGNANLFDGRFEQARSDILQAIRLSPHDPLMFYSRKYLGDAELGVGQFDAGIDDTTTGPGLSTGAVEAVV